MFCSTSWPTHLHSDGTVLSVFSQSLTSHKAVEQLAVEISPMICGDFPRASKTGELRVNRSSRHCFCGLIRDWCRFYPSGKLLYHYGISRTYEFPDAVFGSGPRISKWHFSIGAPAVKELSGALYFLLRCLVRLHIIYSTCFCKFSMSATRFGQTKCFLVLS